MTGCDHEGAFSCVAMRLGCVVVVSAADRNDNIFKFECFVCAINTL